MLGPFSPWKEATGSGLECTAAGVFSMAWGVCSLSPALAVSQRYLDSEGFENRSKS